MKNIIHKILKWFRSHPKMSFFYMMGLLTLSFVFAVFQQIYFPPKIKTPMLPPLYQQSDIKISESNNINLPEMERVVRELESLKTKRDKRALTKDDSLRIEYLYNKFQTLKK